MNNFKIAVMAISFLFLLVSCSDTNEDQPNIAGESPNDELIAKVAFDGDIYSVLHSHPMTKQTAAKLGTINDVVAEINKNGEAKVYEDSVNLNAGDGIYEMKKGDKEQTVAVKIEGSYYTAIYNSKLK